MTNVRVIIAGGLGDEDAEGGGPGVTRAEQDVVGESVAVGAADLERPVGAADREGAEDFVCWIVVVVVGVWSEDGSDVGEEASDGMVARGDTVASRVTSALTDGEPPSLLEADTEALCESVARAVELGEVVGKEVTLTVGRFDWGDAVPVFTEITVVEGEREVKIEEVGEGRLLGLRYPLAEGKAVVTSLALCGNVAIAVVLAPPLTIAAKLANGVTVDCALRASERVAISDIIAVQVTLIVDVARAEVERNAEAVGSPSVGAASAVREISPVAVTAIVSVVVNVGEALGDVVAEADELGEAVACTLSVNWEEQVI